MFADLLQLIGAVALVVGVFATIAVGPALIVGGLVVVVVGAVIERTKARR